MVTYEDPASTPTAALGAHPARESQKAVLRAAAQRIDSLELVGGPEPIHSAFVVGLKKLPLRDRVSQAA